MKEYGDIEMAYIAGVMDGDGSFSLIKRKNGLRSPLYQPLIQMGNVSYELVLRMQEAFGGYIHTRSAYIGKDGSNRQEFFSWKLDKTNACTPLLKRLAEFLVIKKERAKFLLDYIGMNPFKRGSNRLTPDVLEKREQAYNHMISLNENPELIEYLGVGQTKDMSKDPMFWSYLAGLMDTDGSFTINKYHNNPSILLTMTDVRAINFFRKGCSVGNFCFVDAQSCKKKSCYRFYITGRQEAIPFLKEIIPYLFVKRQVAEYLLEYCQSMNVTKYRRSGISEDELLRRRSCHEHIVGLNSNKHGVYKPSLIDLEVPKRDDRAQAGCEAVQGERLSERDADNSVCDSLTTAIAY